ncbi:MAG: tetratricopeptide repeat protein [Chthoniobacterales bacterium]|nr:tetratricopeptide repeat protein [Chthoniobacterales bacterium]MCX7712148.1 tetratricopeptide repeat protein [Chthoniobacterales bacterium]
MNHPSKTRKFLLISVSFYYWINISFFFLFSQTCLAQEQIKLPSTAEAHPDSGSLSQHAQPLLTSPTASNLTSEQNNSIPPHSPPLKTPSEPILDPPSLDTNRKTLPAEAFRLMASGNAALEASDYETAAEFYRQARILAPDWVPLLVNSALAELRSKRPQTARQIINHALRQDFTSSRVWLTLGILALDEKDYPSALAAFAQAVALEPENPHAKNYLGVAAASLGWLDAAEDNFQQAIRLKPDFADAHFNLAATCIQKKTPAIEIARHHYQLALHHGAISDPEIEKKLNIKKQ